MKIRLALALIALIMPLAISADYRSKRCEKCWLEQSKPLPFDAGLGVNIHFIDPQPGEVKMIADAGFRWIRTDFKWDLTERKQGQYDFSPYDRLMAALEPHKLNALFILDYGNPIYTGDKSIRTEEARQAFVRWAVAAATHFAGRGIIWEVFNEPNNSMFWPPQPNVNEYTALALGVSAEFQTSLPHEKLVGAATAGVDFPFLDSCFKANLLDYWSGVSVHPYRQTSPETAAVDLARLREVIQQYGGRSSREVSLISGEWGYSSAWSGMTEEKQAAMLVREFLTTVAHGASISIWYDWRDDGLDPKEAEFHFGLVRHKYRSGQTQVFEPKPAYLAATTLITVLKGFRFQQRLNVGNVDDYVLVFERDGQRRIVAWTTLTTAHRLTLPDSAGQFSVINMLGGEGGRGSAAQSPLTIEVSNSPVYLIPSN